MKAKSKQGQSAINVLRHLETKRAFEENQEIEARVHRAKKSGKKLAQKILRKIARGEVQKLSDTSSDLWIYIYPNWYGASPESIVCEAASMWLPHLDYNIESAKWKSEAGMRIFIVTTRE